MKNTKSRVFKIREQIKNIYFGAKGFVMLRTSKKYKILTKQFKERIMLAITEVNGCTMCSYVHTKMALSSGMSKEEIKSILDGEGNTIPLEQALAVMYAQNFASSKEILDYEVINRLIAEYGIKKANLIVAACYMITMTNGMGTSLEHFYNRLRFNSEKESNILLELLNPLLTMILFPIFVIIFFLLTIFGFKQRTLKPSYVN